MRRHPLNHIVRAQRSLRDREVERFASLEINHQLGFGRLLALLIGRLPAVAGCGRVALQRRVLCAHRRGRSAHGLIGVRKTSARLHHGMTSSLMRADNASSFVLRVSGR
jgi:hypothetical protein